jgi:hypothetical protein
MMGFIYLCTYDLYGPLPNVFDAGRYITWASGRGMGPGNGEFFGPKKLEIFSAQPPPTCPRNVYARIKNITYRDV